MIDRVEHGERLTVTRDGRGAAELRLLERPSVNVGALIERWRRLPQFDPDSLRADLDRALDPLL
jgi:antitoxin (DNA-binding transcriptional repressor) of toxin-antitoxin stability system